MYQSSIGVSIKCYESQPAFKFNISIYVYGNVYVLYAYVFVYVYAYEHVYAYVYVYVDINIYVYVSILFIYQYLCISGIFGMRILVVVSHFVFARAARSWWQKPIDGMEFEARGWSRQSPNRTPW